MTIQIRTRAAWNARPPKHRVQLPTRLLAGVTVHWFGSPKAVSRPEDVAGQLRSVQNGHMAPGGLGAKDGGSDIGYNHAVDQFGRAWELRGFDVRTGANGTTQGNATHAAVAVTIGTGDKPTLAALDMTGRLIGEYRHRGAGREVLPHRAWTGSTCPGPDLLAWIAKRGFETGPPPKEDPTMIAGWTFDQIRALARWHLAEKRQTPRPPIPKEVPAAVWAELSLWHPILNLYAEAHPVGDKELQAKLAAVRQAVCQ